MSDIKNELELAIEQENNMVKHRAAELAYKERIEMARMKLEERMG